MWALVVSATLSATIALADEPPKDWIARFNEIHRFPYPEAEAYEKIIDLAEVNDYLRVHEVVAANLYSKKEAPWRPLPIEMEALIWLVFKLRNDTYEQARSNHASDLDQAQENLCIAYRRMAQLSKSIDPHLFTQVALIRGVELCDDGNWNVGGQSPVPLDQDLVWRFYVGGAPKNAVVLDDLSRLYYTETLHRRSNPLVQILSFFTLRLWFVSDSEDDIELKILRDQAFVVQIDGRDGYALELPLLKEEALKERTRVDRKTQGALKN